MSVLYCQSPALFWCALALIVCFFVRRGAHRVRAVLDLVLGLLCIVGGVALYYLGMYNDAFTIRDFWQIRTAGWIGLAAVVLVTAWQVIKATRRSVSARPPGGAGRAGPPPGAGGGPQPGLCRRSGGRQGRQPGGRKRLLRRQPGKSLTARFHEQKKCPRRGHFFYSVSIAP